MDSRPHNGMERGPSRTSDPDLFACAELGCPALDADTLALCFKRSCPFAYVRQREEDQVARDRKDGKVIGEG